MVGQTISHYEILEKLGEGGMGVVYKARDTKLDRVVALKFLPLHGRTTSSDTGRFVQEGRAAAALNHPNICTVFAFEEADGNQFIAMEYLEGVTLREHLSAPTTSGRSADTANEAVAFGIQICEALHEAHTKGVVHRDVKPENIMVTRRGQVKVMDFGLAQLKGADRLTKDSNTVGTIAYMAPEVFQGGMADARSDIFSFGVMFYEHVTGKRPFRGEHQAAMVYSILNEDPIPLESPSLPSAQALAPIISRMLHKDPRSRYQSMEEVLDDLRRVDTLSSPAAASAQDPRPRGPGVKSLAVLPFENISPEREHEYFSEGLTEEIIASLSKVGSLAVISRTSVMRYRGTQKPLRTIARELHVEYILEGTVRKQRNDLRITAKLIKADEDVQMWAETYRGTMDDVFEIQERVASQIADAFRVQLTPTERLVLRKRYTSDPEAYELYLQGRFWWNKRSEEGFRRAISFFEQAIARDPTYAIAHAGLSDCYNLLSAYAMVPPGSAAPTAEAAAMTALRLDPDLAEAHEANAHVGMLFAWNRSDVEQTFRRAITLNPQYATAHQRLAIYMAATGRTEDALAVIHRARELDPLSLIINADEALILTLNGRHEAAIDRCRRTMEIDPAFWVARLVLGLAYEQAGKLEEAVAEFERAVALSAQNVILLSALGHALGRQQRLDEAHRILSDLLDRSTRAFVPSYAQAVVHAGLGNGDQAMRLLAHACDQRSVWLVHIHFASDPRLSTLHGRPDFVGLISGTPFGRHP